MRYRFERSVNVEQTPYPAGTEIDGDELLAGTIDSLSKIGAIVQIEDEAKEPKNGKGKKATKDEPAKE